MWMSDIENHTLSYQELSFSILIESYGIVCPYLSDIVVNAVKTSNPEKWKDVISSCFTDKVKQHVKKCLNNDQPITDFYAVCKLLRDRLNDVAHFRGEPLLNPHEKERLSLQVQGVETPRHWVFHGEQYVSAEEVRSSISLLLAILRTLSGSSDFAKTVGIQNKMSKFYTYAEVLCTGNADTTYILRTNTLGSAMLYSGLKELQRGLTPHFQQGKNDIKSGRPPDGVRPGENIVTGDNIQGLMKKIRKKISEKRHRRRLQELAGDEGQSDGVVMCNHVLAMRNALAHNDPLTLKEIAKALIYIRNLLSTFELCCDETEAAITRTSRLDNDEKGDVSCCLMKIDHKNNFGQNTPCWRRILRPRSHNFVGREKELSIIKLTLEGQQSQTIKAVLMFGQAGLGKSFLANQMANELANTFRVQIWLSCSNNHELQEDLSRKQLATFNEGPVSAKQLLVLDDVCPCTMNAIPALIIKDRASAIITTRSTVVKQFLQRELHPLTVIDLKPFLAAESWKLMKKKIDMSKVDGLMLNSMNNTLNNVLHNLPLCVSIYSSFCAFTAKSKHHAASEGIGCQSLINWKEIEEHFGDRFHVRGLTGIVQSAEYYLEDHPLVVFLLMKICLVNTNLIPWEIITKKSSRGELGIYMKIDCSHEKDLVWYGYFLSGLFGVTDWFFSDGGKLALEGCRDTLEELGLIGWNSSLATVSIHGLTRVSLKSMMERRASFLDTVISNAMSMSQSIERSPSEGLVEYLSRNLSNELTLQVFNKSVELAQEARDNFLENLSMESLPFVYDFLIRVVEGTILQLPMRILLSDWFERFILLVFLYPVNGIPTNDNSNENDCSELNLMFAQCVTLNSEKMEKFNIYCRLSNCIALYGKCSLGYRMESSELIPPTEDCTLSKGFYHITLYLLRRAMTIQSRGSKARKSFLSKASQKFKPVDLFNQPTADSLRQNITNLSMKGSSADQILHCSGLNVKESTALASWCITAAFQAQDSLEDKGEVDEQTLEVLSLLITSLQHRQKLIFDAMLKQSTIQTQGTKIECSFILLTGTRYEAMLWERLQRIGQCLRGAVKTYNAIEIVLKDISLSGIGILNHEVSVVFRLAVKELVGRGFQWSLSLGMYSGLSKYLKAIRDCLKGTVAEVPLPETERQSCTLSSTDIVHRYTCIGSGTTLDTLLFVHDVIQNMFEGFGFEAALKQLMRLLKWYLKPGVQHDIEQLVVDSDRDPIVIVLHYIARLSSLFEHTCDEVLETLLSLQKYTRPTNHVWLTDLLRKTIDKICSLTQCGATTLLKPFVESARAFTAGDCLAARSASFVSMRRIIHILSEEPNNSEDLLLVLPNLFVTMLLHLTYILHIIYAKDLKYDAVEWFITFRCQIAKDYKLSILAGQFGFEYINFLKERGKLHEALERCRVLQCYYVDQFGEDYQDWLQEAPNLRQMLMELECLLQQAPYPCSTDTALKKQKAANSL